MRRRRRPGAGDPLRYAPRPAAGDAPPPDAPEAGTSDVLPAPVVRALGALHAPPGADGAYWDGLEGRVMAAVRGAAGAAHVARAVPAAAAQWWQALARWTRPALAAATVALVVAGAALARAGAVAEDRRAHSAFRAVLGDPYDPWTYPVPEAAPQLARAADAHDVEPGDTAAAADARAARLASELLSGGLVRRRPPSPDHPADGRARVAPEPAETPERRARREATFRLVVPGP